jgi:ankyrin repeat protein
MGLIDNDDVEGLRRWLDGGGDVRARDDVVLGITALEHAAHKGRLEIVKLLVSRGAKPRRGLFGPSAHRYALQAGHQDVAAYLAEQGMARGYRLHQVAGAVFMLLALALYFVPQPRELLDNQVVLIFLVGAVVLAVGISLAYDWLRKTRR